MKRLLVLLTILFLLVPAQAYALGEEEIINILNGASTLTGSGRDWSGTGAAFAPPVLINSDGIPTIGSFHEIHINEHVEIVLFIGDPEDRARWVEWEVTSLQGEVVLSGEVDCRDLTMASIPIRFESPGLYYIAFYLSSKVRGQGRFIVTWNEAIERTTDTTQMLISVIGGSSQPSTDPIQVSEDTGIYLMNSMVNFGSLPRYYTAGVSSLQLVADFPTLWRVTGPDGLQIFENEHYLNFDIESSGTWIFEADGDQMVIHVLAGPSKAIAISNSDETVTTDECGNIQINLSASAYAYSESNPVYIIGTGEPIREEVDEVDWTNFYPINNQLFRVGIPQNQIIHWIWDNECWQEEDPTCGPPPGDWGWEPPVPPPPGPDEPLIPPAL